MIKIDVATCFLVLRHGFGVATGNPTVGKKEVATWELMSGHGLDSRGSRPNFGIATWPREGLGMSRPESRSDPIGRSEPVSGTRDSGLGLLT